jgi:RimJ/RimL family protein N-acetyltransferase
MAVDDGGMLPDELVGDRVILRRYRPSDAETLRVVLAANHERLSRWMPWAQEPPTDASVHQFLDAAVHRFGQASADYAITLATDPGRPYVGGCGLIDRVGPGALEVGYWLDGGHTGRGLVTEAAALLTRSALALPGVERVEIHCDQANHLSAAVPERLGYRLARVEPDEIRAPGESGRSMIWVCDALACQGASHG